jgi:DnaJ-domain-containing protein 1
MRIVGYRAICSCALLRFKESAEDGVACLDIRRRLRQSGCVFSGEDDARFCARVNECVMRALVMSERYEEADAVASSLSGGLSSLSVATSGEPSASDDGNAIAAAAAASAATSTIPTASTWKSAILPLRRFRSAVAARHWRDALSAVDDHATTPGATAAAAAAAMACLRASPLCVMLAFVHLEAGHPMTARALLLAYLAELPEPPTWDALSSALLEHEQLWDSFRSHYVFSTTLLAKASVMSGSAYLNIAAALLQRCLRVLPLYTPARLLAEFVLGYEAQQAALDLAMAKHDFSAALLISSRMLGMPEICPALEAEVYLVRMQVQWLRRLPLEVVREASLCIAADPTCALAFRLRADALESMNQAAEAVADRAATAHCSTKAVVEAAFTKLLVQREKYEAAQRTSTTQRWSFTAFAATPAAAAASSHLHGYARENDSDNGNSAEATRTIRGSRTGAGGGQSSFASRNTAKEEPSHYAVLGVSPRATGDEVRQRYRYLTLRCHPDRLVNASAERRAEAAEEFKRVSNAYSVLSDPLQRSEYDATLPFLS